MRTSGFVLGLDLAPDGRKIWKVRIKDRSSPHDGEKLIVASVHGGLELAQGLNVHFAIGTIDGPLGEKVLRAVDVSLEIPGWDQSSTYVKRS